MFQVLIRYCTQHPGINKAPPLEQGVQPLLNYTFFLIELIVREEVRGLLLFVFLRLSRLQPLEKYVALGDVYSEHLQHSNSTVLSCIDKIGQLYFGLAPPEKKRETGGFIGQLLKGLMAGIDDDDESEMPPASQQSSTATRKMQDDDALD